MSEMKKLDYNGKGAGTWNEYFSLWAEKMHNGKKLSYGIMEIFINSDRDEVFIFSIRRRSNIALVGCRFFELSNSQSYSSILSGNEAKQYKAHFQGLK